MVREMTASTTFSVMTANTNHTAKLISRCASVMNSSFGRSALVEKRSPTMANSSPSTKDTRELSSAGGKRPNMKKTEIAVLVTNSVKAVDDKHTAEQAAIRAQLGEMRDEVAADEPGRTDDDDGLGQGG